MLQVDTGAFVVEAVQLDEPVSGLCVTTDGELIVTNHGHGLRLRSISVSGLRRIAERIHDTADKMEMTQLMRAAVGGHG